MTKTEILNMAIEAKGATHQDIIAIEECSELIQAITHKHRGRNHNLADEIADVEIMLEQWKIINGCTEEVEQVKKYKIERLLHRLRGETI